jgi:hypothetical protein
LLGAHSPGNRLHHPAPPWPSKCRQSHTLPAAAHCTAVRDAKGALVAGTTNSHIRGVVAKQAASVRLESTTAARRLSAASLLAPHLPAVVFLKPMKKHKHSCIASARERSFSALVLPPRGAFGVSVAAPHTSSFGGYADFKNYLTAGLHRRQRYVANCETCQCVKAEHALADLWSLVN